MIAIVRNALSGGTLAESTPLIPEPPVVSTANIDFWDVFFIIFTVIVVIGLFGYIASRKKKR